MKFKPSIGKLEWAFVRCLRLNNKYPPLFIVGPPRAGTTLVYLHIFNVFKWSYFPNVAKNNPYSCIYKTYFNKKKYSYTPTYENNYGEMQGPMAPSDGWGIFHRWWPKYDHNQKIKTSNLHELKTIVRLFEKMFGAPFINKNNANPIRILELSELFPEALFIRVKRDIYDEISSIMKGRKNNNIPNDQWWGVAPPQYFDKKFSCLLERTIYQVQGVEQFLDKKFGIIPKQQRTTVSYEYFCDHPHVIIDWVEERYRTHGCHLERRSTGSELPRSFTVSRIDYRERLKLKSRVDSYLRMI